MILGGRVRSGAAALIVAATCTALGLLWYQATRSDVGSFFVHEAPAEWIVYPQPASLGVRGRTELQAAFWREFELPAKPEAARLHVRMHRKGVLSINGSPVHFASSEGVGWKRGSGGDVAKLLRAGRNRIHASVSVDAGPPALWLTLEADGMRLASDASWTASLMGAEDAPVRLARQPMSEWARAPRNPDELDATNPRPLDALRARAQSLVVLFGVGGVLAGAVAWGLRGARELSARWSLGAWLVAVLVWVALFVNNRSLHGAWGFDVSGHHDYITVILRHGHLPLADEGFQMYQPPLFYLLAAGLLKLAGIASIDQHAVELLRVLGCLAGVLQITFLLLGLRELFPERPGLVLCAFVFGAFLPVQLYLAQYLTNENWVAALSSGALWWTIRMLRRASSRAWEHAVLGGFLGLALLAKFSALVPLGLCLSVLFLRRWLAGRRSASEHLRLFGTTIAVVLVICGWHYLRVALHFGGNPFVGNWDEASGYIWWQDPGYHVFEDYARFGRALERPLQSAIASVPDALYSTFWGDGLIGGSGFSNITPPWDLGWMAVGYALALGPCLTLLLGGLLAGIDFVRRPRAERLLMVFVLGATLFLLLSLTIRLPFYAQAKAFYGLSALVPLAFCFALGFDALALRVRALAPLGVTWLAGWALVALATFFASAERLAEDPMRQVMQRDPGGWVAKASLARTREQPAEAIEALRRALEVDPDQPQAGPLLVKLLRDAHRDDEALRAARAALRIDPYSVGLHLAARDLWEAQGATRRAAFHREAAKRLSRGRVGR